MSLDLYQLFQHPRTNRHSTTPFHYTQTWRLLSWVIIADLSLHDKSIGMTPKLLFRIWAQAQREPGRRRPGSRTSQVKRLVSGLSCKARVLFLDHTLVQLLKQRRRLAQRLPHRQLARRPGPDGLAMVTDQSRVTAQPAEAGLLFVLDDMQRAKKLPLIAPDTRAASVPCGAGSAPGSSSGCPRRAR